jgi:integrase
MVPKKDLSYAGRSERLKQELLQSVVNINEELKRDKVRVTLRSKSDSYLVLSYTDPAGTRKEISPPTIALNRSGIELARKFAYQIREAIINGVYCDNWLKSEIYRKVDRTEKTILTWGAVLDGWSDLWLRSRSGSKTSQRQIDRTLIGYRAQIKLVANLPLDTEFNADAITALLDGQAEGTDKRFRLREIMSVLAALYGVGYNFKNIGKRPKPERRDIPTDAQIIDMWRSFDGIYKSKQADLSLVAVYQWYFAVLATYGLRPQELFAIDLDKSFKADNQYWLYLDESLVDGLKTGDRWVCPLHADWVELFGIADIKPRTNFRGSNNVAVKSASVATYFGKHKIGCKPYDLRHAYAIRCRKAGLSLSDSADSMGHDPRTHSKQYQRWISLEDRIQSVRNALDRNPNH